MIVPSVRFGFEEGAWDTGDHGSGTAPSSRFWVSRWWRPGRSRRRPPPGSLQGPYAVVAWPCAAGTAPGTVRVVVRLDQFGYAIGEAKRAYLMAEAPADTARFAVVDAGWR